VTGVCDMLGQVAKAKRRNVQLMIASAVSFVLACVGVFEYVCVSGCVGA